MFNFHSIFGEKKHTFYIKKVITVLSRLEAKMRMKTDAAYIISLRERLSCRKKHNNLHNKFHLKNELLLNSKLKRK